MIGHVQREKSAVFIYFENRLKYSYTYTYTLYTFRFVSPHFTLMNLKQKHIINKQKKTDLKKESSTVAFHVSIVDHPKF